MHSNKTEASHHLYPTQLRFAVFSSEDIKKLSVARIYVSHTFDVLGRAMPGGLYDPAMGPSRHDGDPCATCFNNISNCPGHIGHIELYMMIYNPLFIQTVCKVLQITCLTCYQLQLSEHVRKILELQLKLVDAGYLIEAQEIDIYKSELVANSSKNRIKTEEGHTLHPKIAEYAEMLQKNPKNPYNNKNIESARMTIISSTLRMASKKNCMFCKAPLKRVKYSYKTLMMVVPKSEMKDFYKSKGSDVINPDQTESSIRSANKAILADECCNFFRIIYSNCPDFFKLLFPVLQHGSTNVSCPTDIFFSNVIPVTPPLVRPTEKMADKILEHHQTVNYKKIIDANITLKVVMNYINLKNSEIEYQPKNLVYENVMGETAHEKMYNAWRELQSYVDETLDINMAKTKTRGFGLKQILEKKEGIIRMNMMGKRVNFAARTVITPDPNVAVDEIGFPEIFAKKLTYPVPVTSWNVSELRKLIMNGPDCHPGANFLEDEKGYKTLIPLNDEIKRESLAKLLAIPSKERGVQIVHRHLVNGDILLMNRQPTLHRPSIMAHKARILKGEKTFRLHYSNCKSYNADFDGDEMNAHCPQNELGRSEGYNLVNVTNHYLVPKDGSPLGGLIQDHIISGVYLCMRGRFFNKKDYQQLVFQGLSNIKGDIKLLSPSIIKPLKLWSGKQILSTIILNMIPPKKKAINLISTAKIYAKSWQNHPEREWKAGGTLLLDNELSEAEVIIKEGELLVGILDKKHYGSTAYGLIHCMYDLYGGTCATNLLTSFTRLFTFFLQWEGFTLGVHDILILEQSDELRQQLIAESRKIGHATTAAALNLPENISPDELAAQKEEAYIKDPKFRTVLDRQYKSALDKFTNNINDVCIPLGLISKFPDNNLQLMVLSGAKGSTVNAMQISSLLGQIELEGKRPPLMISGKSLPSFAAFETSPKSGGFIDGRFLTGIQPQDFFFHCMAGREGLIDTAVKTSRSGYLQRCLIKHLEGLSVHYDMTVRDSDSSVIQYLYGEDGMDISKSQFLKKKQLPFLNDNIDVIINPEMLKGLQNDSKEEVEYFKKHLKKIKSWNKKNKSLLNQKIITPFDRFSMKTKDEIEVKKPNKINPKTGRRRIDEKLCKLWSDMSDDQKKKYDDKKMVRSPDPIISKYSPNIHFGSISEYLKKLIESYAKEHSDRQREFKEMINLKSMLSLTAPGEPVGLLAAQSIGEPSTQMTLNTFHFAGRGEMNVTLGIPRLREILIFASSNIKTPSMDIPFIPQANIEKKAEKLRVKLMRVTVADVLESINIRSHLILRPQRVREYILRFNFLPREAYKQDNCVKPKEILKHMSSNFFKLMFRIIIKSTSEKNFLIEIDKEKSSKKTKLINEEDEAIDEIEPTESTKPSLNDESSDDEPEDEGDATTDKLKKNRSDENDYDDPDDEEEQKDADEGDEIELDNDNDDLLDKDDDNILKEHEETMNVLQSNEFTDDYKYDKESHLWCELFFHLPLKYNAIDLTTILRELAKNSVIWQVPNIKRAITYYQNDQLVLKTQGINIKAMSQYNKLLDLNRLYCNDINGIANMYGIEAARRVLVKEIQNVFKVYGITVDPRHLLLIADYMTFDGTFQPLNRTGINSSASPLQQMSFESCMQFLKTALVSARNDNLNSPSSRIILGQPCKSGTGAFDLINDNSLYLRKFIKS